MHRTTLIQLSPEDLINKFGELFYKQMLKFVSNTHLKKLNSDERPHLTRKETAIFFDVSLNCINDWSKKGILKPIKVGQRTYFRKSDLLELMFNQLEN